MEHQMAYGIDLSAAALEEFRLAQGITTSYSAMTQAEKVMLRYQYLMANTKTQQGDFIRTNASLANSFRTLQAYAQATGTQIGAGLGAAIRIVIGWLNSLMSALLKAATAFAVFMQTLFGKYKGGASGIAMNGLEDAAGYADDLSDAAGGAAGGLGGAAGAAEDLKKNLSVLPFDELNQLSKDNENAGGGGGGGGGGGLGDVEGLLDWEELVGESPVAQAINEWAQQIKDAFQKQDWDLLGRVIADGMNRAMAYLYEVLDPQKIASIVDPWIDAFTQTFNSWVNAFDWELLGRIVGRGINNVVHILNRTIDGIDWWTLGYKIATGINGLFDEVNWEELGDLVGNKFQALLDYINGFVHGFEWDDLGRDVATFFNHVFDKVNFDSIAGSLAGGLNGAFISLANFTATFEWTDLTTKIANGINKFIRDFNWKENGEKLGEFLENLCGALIDLVGTVNWEELGQGIADFLQELPWGKLLWTAAYVFIKIFGGLLKGMASTPAGKFATAFLAAVCAFQVGSHLMGFINKIGRAIKGDSSWSVVHASLEKLFGKSIKTAGESEAVKGAAETAGETIGKTFATKVGEFFASEAGTTLIVGGLLTAIASLPFMVKSMDQSLEKSRGGNGIQTSVGTGWDEYTNSLQQAGQLTEQQSQDIFLAKERYESWGWSADKIYTDLTRKVIQYTGNQEEALSIVSKLIQSGNGQQEVYSGIQKTMNNATWAQNGYNNSVLGGATSVEQLKKDMLAAMVVLDQTALKTDITSTAYSGARTALAGVIGGLETSNGVWQAASNFVEQYGGDVKALAAIMNGDYGYAVDMVESNTGRANSSVESLGTTSARTEKVTTDSMRRTGTSVGEAAQKINSKFELTEHGFLRLSDSSEDTADKVGGHSSFMATKLQSKATLMRGDLFKTGKSMDDMGDKSGDLEKTNDNNMTKVASSALAMATKVTGNLKTVGTGLGDNESNVTKWKNTSEKNLQETESSYSKTSAGTAKSLVAMILQMALTEVAIVSLAKYAQNNASSITSSFQTAFSSASSSVSLFASSFSSSMSSVSSIAHSTASSVQSAFSMNLYSYGQSAAQTFASGIASIHIPMPHVFVAGYTSFSIGPASFSIPHLGVMWYRAGGLFTGGKGSIIGIAEDNRDEAVLPLEDRRAMARIGSAIADAGGTQGNEQLVNQLAERIAEIVLMTKEEQRDPILNVVVKTENDEVLARAVTRGQQKLDYRTNPTPSFSY